MLDCMISESKLGFGQKPRILVLLLLSLAKDPYRRPCVRPKVEGRPHHCPRYVVSCLIYLAAVAAIDPHLITSALVPLFTVFAYVTVTFTRLKAGTLVRGWPSAW